MRSCFVTGINYNYGYEVCNIKVITFKVTFNSLSTYSNFDEVVGLPCCLVFLDHLGVSGID